MKIFRTLLFFALTLFFGIQFAGAKELRQVDIADAVEALSQEIALSREASARRLIEIDPAIEPVLREMSTVDGFEHRVFSARTQVEALYQLGEAQKPGEGRRFLAKAASALGRDSAALSVDPTLTVLKGEFTDANLKQSLSFASPTSVNPSAMDRPIPQNLLNAIDLISEASDGPNRFHSVLQISRETLNLGQPPRDRKAVEAAIRRNTTSRDVIVELMTRVHAPPPTVERAAQKMVLEIARGSAALEIDPRFADVIEELAREPIPEQLQRVSDLENDLPSRRTQQSVLGLPRHSSATEARVAASQVASALVEGGIEATQSAMAPGPDGRPQSYRDNRTRHASYSADSLAPRGRSQGAGNVSRKYRSAIRSPRAARGVAVGADVKYPWRSPKSAIWVESTEDPNFGRFLIVFPSGIWGTERLFASQPLYSDSVAAAISTILGNHEGEAEFRDGEITILMSMVPSKPTASEVQAAIGIFKDSFPDEAAIAEVYLTEGGTAANRALAIFPTVDIDMVEEIVGIAQQIIAGSGSPNGVVVHPAVAGYQLSWAAARTDFWFGDSEKLMAEINEVQPLKSAERRLGERFPTNANTWQFYERDSEISLISAIEGEDWGQIQVLSKSEHDTSSDETDSHFSVTLFSYAENRPSSGAEEVEPGVWRLINEEKRAEPLLNFLFTTHPDFLRLNHYSEALSIVRWLDSNDVGLTTLDASGVPATTIPPKYVFVGGRGLDIDRKE